MTFGDHVLTIDPAAETERIVSMLRSNVGQSMRKRGAVVGISGGIDSSVCLALSMRAFGSQRTVAVIMPERDSDPESRELATMLANHFDVEPIVENITPILDGFGCYARRDE